MSDISDEYESKEAAREDQEKSKMYEAAFNDQFNVNLDFLELI